MADQGGSRSPVSDADLRDLVASSDTGARHPVGIVGKLLAGVALAWSLFQLWIASPLPFMVADILPVLNDTRTRSIHLAFAVFLAFMAYPALRTSPRDRIPPQDWILALLGAFAAAYFFIFYSDLARRPGAPIQQDLIIAGIGLVALLEATRRALGPPLMIVAIVFLLYVFFGDSAVVPEAIRWKGASFAKAMSHMWLTTEGVFGIALGVSTGFVFLFVLFGSLLDKAGAGNYFIKVAFSLLGHLRGGPAKAAVLSSAMTGLISGSSIANVVTTGTFTIPLMKRVGFTAEQAGSVEVASSVNGQIMPPVMGAAAFLMVEYVGIPYVDVIKHAFLPALISYIALLYIVHLQALKMDMKALPKPGEAKPVPVRLLRAGISLCSILILCGITYFGIQGIKAVLGDVSGAALAVVLGVVYVALVAFGARAPDLEMDDPDAPVIALPEFGKTFRTGLHFILPIAVLVWFLMVERKSPGLSAFWASALMLVVLITQHPLKALFRRTGDVTAGFRRGWSEMLDGLISGARNMIGIGVATAAAGIIVGTVTLTGIGQVMTEFVEIISGGNLMLMLVFVAIISLILGMGLPTTANYIVVSSLMAGVVVELGAQSGLIVPLIAVHMFVFYFGIMADVTPPVGLASFAAAAVSGGDPIRTGFTAFFYSLRTVLLPFIFIFNTDLLLIDVGIAEGILVFFVSTLAMLIFAAGTQGFFIVRNRYWESAVMIAVALTLLRPGFWLDMVEPEFNETDPVKILETAEGRPAGTGLRVRVEGENLDGRFISTTVELPLGATGDGKARLESAGLEVKIEEGKALVDNVVFGSPAAKARIDLDWQVKAVLLPNERMPKELFFIPALLAFAGIWWIQRRRQPVAS